MADDTKKDESLNKKHEIEEPTVEYGNTLADQQLKKKIKKIEETSQNVQDIPQIEVSTVDADIESPKPH